MSNAIPSERVLEKPNSKMDDFSNEIIKATLMVQQMVENKQDQLDTIVTRLQENNVLPPQLTRFHVEKGTTTAAIEALKHNLAYLEGELEVMKEHDYERKMNQ